MKIAVWHNLPSGGGKRLLYDHIYGLVKLGHEVEIWMPPTVNRRYADLGSLVKEHVIPLKYDENRKWILGPYSRIIEQIKAMDEHCLICANEINQRKFDILFANACQFFRTTSIAKNVKIPSLIYLGEPYRWLYEALPNNLWAALSSPEHFWKYTSIKLLLRDELRLRAARIQVREEITNAKAFDKILVNSLYSRESILRAYGIDSTVCYPGIDASLFVDEQQPRENLVVGIGALMAEKNIHFVIDALGYVPEPRPRLVWIGNVAGSTYLSWLTRLAQERGVNFTPLQMIPDDDVVGWLNRAFAFVYSPRLEPFGLAPLEANACGTPAIGVAEGGVRETIIHEQTGLLTDATPQAFAQAIVRLRDNPVLAHALGQRAKERVQDFWSVDAAVDRLEAQLWDVLNTKDAV